MAEESTATAEATAEAPASTESAPVEGQATDTGAEGQAEEVATDGEGGDEGQAEAPEFEPDPDTTAWLEGKKLSIDGVEGDTLQNLYKLAGMARNSESEMSRAKNELSEVQKSNLLKAAQNEVSESEKEPEKSPVENHTERWKILMDNQVFLYGVQGEADLKTRYPDVYNKLKTVEEAEYRDALTKQVDFQTSQVTNQIKANERAGTLKAESAKMDAAYTTNMAEAKKADAEIEVKFAKSGVADFLGYMSNVTKIPVNYLGADPKTFQKMVEFATAHDFYANRDEHGAKLREEILADVEKKSNAELVSGSSPEPKDKLAVRTMRIQRHGKGTSILH